MHISYKPLILQGLEEQYQTHHSRTTRRFKVVDAKITRVKASQRARHEFLNAPDVIASRWIRVGGNGAHGHQCDPRSRTGSRCGG